jgi:hypothetical protein
MPAPLRPGTLAVGQLSRIKLARPNTEDKKLKSWRLKRGPDLTPREALANINKTPHLWLMAGAGPIGASLLKADAMTSYITAGVLLVVGAFLVAAAIKQRKKAKRARLAANPPETS